MRRRILLSIALAALAAGCVESRLAGIDDRNPPPEGGAPTPSCVADTDCELAGPSCCDCPTFAVPVASGWGDSCADVECTPGRTCSALVARCTQSACVAACAPVACALTCTGGFAVDAAGCQVCACADATSTAICMGDSDCVQVPADCCGCTRGGMDTAVPASAVDAHLGGLMCPQNPSCPDVSTCDPDARPRCVSGRCGLYAPGDDVAVPAGACGHPELPSCPEGTRCTLNVDPAATRRGLGTCSS